MSLAWVSAWWAVTAGFSVASVVLFWRRVALWLARRHHGMADGELGDLFIFIAPRRLSALLAASGSVVLVILLLLGLPALVSLSIALLWVLGPRWLLDWARRRRQARLLLQLPDAVALLSGLLRAGHGLGHALGLLALRQASPLGQELQLLVRKHRIGVALDDALQEFAARVPESDVRLIVLAIRVSREIGGNLAESLQRLGEGIRARVLLRERIDALTAQGRMQGVIVGLLPLLLMLALSVVDPVPMGWLFTTFPGRATLAVIAVLEFSGYLLIRRIVRIDL